MIIKYLTLTLFTALIIIPAAQARIDIVPQKILIENRERSGEFTVLNLLNAPGTFRVEIVNYEQFEDGRYVELTNPLNPDFDPQSIVRVSPRQFSLDTNGRQKVRLSLRKPADLAQGEYRFHVKAIRMMQDNDLKEDSENTVSVLANIGVTIPVIVRHGNLGAEASIKNINLLNPSQTESQKPELHLDILRTGDASTIGLLEVLWRSQGETNAKRIGRITNMNIFTDIEKRQIKLPLYEMPEGTGTLIVRYADGIDKGKIYDEVSMKL